MMTPETLRAAEADPSAEAWDTIWDESCHQGEALPGSEVLLPWLARTAAGFGARERERAVVLAGFIAVDGEREPYAAAVSELRALAVEGLADASSDDMFVYLQQAVLGFDGDEYWGKHLDLVNDGETDAECPSCGDEWLIDLTADDPRVEPGLGTTTATRVHGEAMAAGRGSVAAAYARLFGRITCESCGHRFELGATPPG